MIPTTNIRSSYVADAPPFEEVLLGERKEEPWRPDRFLLFLKSELNDENFFFFEEVEALKVVLRLPDAKQPPEHFLVLPSLARKDEKTFIDSLVQTFIKDGAEKQVNISSDQRTKILKEKEYQGFEEAQAEVKRLMMQDSYPRFINKMFTENIGEVSINNRLHIAILSGLVYLLALGLFLGLFVPRWYFFLLFLPIFNCVEYLMVWKTKVCPMRATLGKCDRMKDKQDCCILDTNCPLVKKKIRLLAAHYMLISFACSIVITLISFALTYAVEAGQGKVLYG